MYYSIPLCASFFLCVVSFLIPCLLSSITHHGSVYFFTRTSLMAFLKIALFFSCCTRRPAPLFSGSRYIYLSLLDTVLLLLHLIRNVWFSSVWPVFPRCVLIGWINLSLEVSPTHPLTWTPVPLHSSHFFTAPWKT